MARRHGGLGRGLDALIPMREEVEKAMSSAGAESVEILFNDDEETEKEPARDNFVKDRQIVSRETFEDNRVPDNKELEERVSEKDSRAEAEINARDQIISESIANNEIKNEIKNDQVRNDADRSDPVTVRISEVEPNRDQPRKYFDDEKLEELSESIKTYGILQPILVQKKDGYYEIIAGERRWRAALKAGLKEIPVIIREYTDKEILELSLIENIQREDLNPIEEAEAYKRLIDEFGMSQEEMAKRVSKSRSAVANSLRLLKLEGDVRKMLVDGQLSMGHARALLPLEIAEEQIEVARKVADRQLSVRETEKLVRDILKTGAGSGTKAVKTEQPQEDPSIAVIYKQIEERLQQTLHTKVQIQRKRNGHGKLMIDFYGSDDLDKIIDRLIEARTGPANGSSGRNKTKSGTRKKKKSRQAVKKA